MKKILVTGGTVFVSKFVAKYFAEQGHDVYVLNRNTREQVSGVSVLEGDRHDPNLTLRERDFDAVLDITAYNADDIRDLAAKLGSVGTYVLISSSAVYPEYEPQPFSETSKRAVNKHWGKYGTDKIEAEDALFELCPDAYILRPPYLYGPMNNLYREAFVFDCAEAGRSFYLPRDGEMKLQFFHVRDLCRMIGIILDQKPSEHIYNVGNDSAVTVREWVEACYRVLGREPEFINVYKDIDQRQYFSFYDYEYILDVGRQAKILSGLTDLETGLRESYDWYREHRDEVRRKPLIDFIDSELKL